MANGLTDKQKLFIAYYVQSLNATYSAEKAGYKGDYDTLRSVGSENLAKPHIREEINRILAENNPNPEEITARWAILSKGDLGDFTEIRSREDLKNHPLSYAIKKIEFDELGNITKLELEDKFKALDNLAKLHNMLTDKIEIDVNIKVKDWVEAQKAALKDG